MSDSVLVIGGGTAGIQASLDLAESGARVVLVERAPTIGGRMALPDTNFPTREGSTRIEAPEMSEVGQHPNIEVLSLAEVESVTGEAGRFQVGIRQLARFVTDERAGCIDFGMPLVRCLEREVASIVVAVGSELILST